MAIVREPVPWWVRRRHVGGLGMFVAVCALALLLSGCECGVCLHRQ
jgi:hypothetical protein